MDRIKISKVDDVVCWRQGQRVEGTLHLTAHHIIFRFPVGEAVREQWITYPMIAFCTYRPSPPAIRLRCRDFTFVAFHFLTDEAHDVFLSIKALSRVGRLEKLYAFSYRPHGPERAVNGWDLYDARHELARQGVGEEGSAWRVTDINADYKYSPTYPAVLAVPTAISDNVLNYAGKYRSRARIPVLTYIHPVNNCTITRSSQPLVGVRGNRSPQDEKLVAAICASSSAGDGVYGAQQSNLIVDARPTVNAYAMQAVGMGSENMENYRCATKAYLGIDNIHVMRKSLLEVVDALKDSDLTPLPPSREQLAKSGWIRHIANMLDGAALIARTIGIQHSHVLIHCSDGWDRTAQLSALAQLCLDPFFRTFEGFMVLVEKDWVSFGHMFRHRAGFLGSEKWFEVDDGRALKSFFKRDEVEDDDIKVKETSPVFHQFLDATWQLTRQHPTRFEFNARFLRRLLYHLYSCQYGTFLWDNERERVEAKARQRTRSVWDYFLARREQFVNEQYDPVVNDHVVGRERILLPRKDDVRWWADVFGRTDSEMNGLTRDSSTASSLEGAVEGSREWLGKSRESLREPGSRDSMADSVDVKDAVGKEALAEALQSIEEPPKDVPDMSDPELLLKDGSDSSPAESFDPLPELPDRGLHSSPPSELPSKAPTPAPPDDAVGTPPLVGTSAPSTPPVSAEPVVSETVSNWTSPRSSGLAASGLTSTDPDSDTRASFPRGQLPRSGPRAVVRQTLHAEFDPLALDEPTPVAPGPRESSPAGIVGVGIAAGLAKLGIGKKTADSSAGGADGVEMR
ncbi:phosphatases II [Trichodelitschia bisporula]|uniref:Phosphatases II n=1 Tax=Trichodelitschia bisporula TaxID=703511 RepID=A0A6G1HWP2_9PEZI|nr:phosphatases II [Trichodelitschia bisporula]